jgi:cobalt/nickel transport system permease protein
MHMADALLSPAVGATFWAERLGDRLRVKEAEREHRRQNDPARGSDGRFCVPDDQFHDPGTGSSGHIGGGMVLAIILGPYAAFLAMASVLTVQALFFADGGLLALGCNIWNLGIYPCFFAYPLIYKPLAGNGQSPRRILFASLVSAVAALQLGAFSVVMETALSGKSELPFGAFLLLMQPLHLAIGIVEGFVTAGVISYVRSTRPELLGSAAPRLTGASVSLKKVVVGFVVLTVITGGLLSWFASTRPDGLEWSINKIIGRTEPAGQEQEITKALKNIQEKTALLPDCRVILVFIVILMSACGN